MKARKKLEKKKLDDKRKLRLRKKEKEKKQEDEEMGDVDEEEEGMIEDGEEEHPTKEEIEEYEMWFKMGPEGGIKEVKEKRGGEIRGEFVEYVIQNMLGGKENDEMVLDWFRWFVCNGQVSFI